MVFVNVILKNSEQIVVRRAGAMLASGTARRDLRDLPGC